LFGDIDVVGSAMPAAPGIAKARGINGCMAGRVRRCFTG
jgi:hypothetical protein